MEGDIYYRLNILLNPPAKSQYREFMPKPSLHTLFQQKCCTFKLKKHTRSTYKNRYMCCTAWYFGRGNRQKYIYYIANLPYKPATSLYSIYISTYNTYPFNRYIVF